MVHLSRAVVSVVDQHHVDADPELNSDPTPDFTLVGKSISKNTFVLSSASFIVLSQRLRPRCNNFQYF
jgi:hypothetical protein